MHTNVGYSVYRSAFELRRMHLPRDHLHLMIDDVTLLSDEINMVISCISACRSVAPVESFIKKSTCIDEVVTPASHCGGNFSLLLIFAEAEINRPVTFNAFCKNPD
jgi:hypothetical protein